MSGVGSDEWNARSPDPRGVPDGGVDVSLYLNHRYVACVRFKGEGAVGNALAFHAYVNGIQLDKKAVADMTLGEYEHYLAREAAKWDGLL